MSIPLRIEFPGAFYHVTSRGNERKAIFYSDGYRLIFSDVLAESMGSASIESPDIHIIDVNLV